MSQTTSAAALEALTVSEKKASTLWGFRRRAPHETSPPAAEDEAFTPDTTGYGFENFGRGGLELGGLHRDQQWVGAWGGRC
jgi:hypothetical protein